jgi:hypothetical protein
MLALSLGLVGCASGGGGGSGTDGVRRGGSNRIVADELAGVSELDLFSAVQRLRPAWLRAGTRGQLPSVIVDGTPQPNGAEALRSYRATDVTSLELMSASDATTRYGTGYTGGAIIISTRR